MSILNISVIYLLFFFSSRRRHTRSLRDWSSDVCSSDLKPMNFVFDDMKTKFIGFSHGDARLKTAACHPHGKGLRMMVPRSEERRVGKECRSRWSPYH